MRLEVIPLVGGIRWNSVHKHLFVIHKHIDVITLWQVRYPVQDELRFTREDWDYIEALPELCTPLMEITKQTEGPFTDGTHGAPWETICSFDFILRELDHLKAKFAEEPRYKVLIDRIITTCDKLKIYRNDLNSNIAYIGAVVLKPGLNADSLRINVLCLFGNDGFALARPHLVASSNPFMLERLPTRRPLVLQ